MVKPSSVIEEAFRLYTKNKIKKKNVFNEPVCGKLTENLLEISKNENVDFTRASKVLQISAEIYSQKVDALHELAIQTAKGNFRGRPISIFSKLFFVLNFFA